MSTTKYYQYVDLLKEETLKSTQSMENWVKFIDGASRNFKYNFSEQLLINAQKPTATAIADYDTWNGKLDRVVKTGTAMYIPVNENGKLTVKNYFDVADTITKATSPPVPQWGLSSENEKSVMEHISSQYDLTETLESDTNIGDVLDSVYDKVSPKYLHENLEAINKALEGSGLDSNIADLDDKYERELALESIVYASITLIVNKRLGIRANYEEAYKNMIEPYLHLFNTESSINALGNIVSSLTEECLRSVEVAIKTYDRQQLKVQQTQIQQKQQEQQQIQKERELNEERVHSSSNERNGLFRATNPARDGGNDRKDESGRHDIQSMGIQRDVVRDGVDGRERPDNQDAVSQHPNGRTSANIEEMGHGEDGLLEGTQQVLSGTDGNDRTTQTLSGDTGTGRNTEEINDGSHSERPSEQSNREGQSTRPDGLGGQNEQLPNESTRNDLQRPNIRLDNNSTQLQLDLSKSANITNETPDQAPIDMGAFSMRENTESEIDNNADTPPVSTNDNATNLIEAYARHAEVADPQRVGAGALMTPVFHDMNFNRTGKKIRVMVEEPAGKYKLYSREEHGHTNLYLLTASGMITRTSDYFPNEWSDEKEAWVAVRPTEAQLDELLPQIATQFEQDMASPSTWAKYQHAAVVNRIDDCEAHNVPVRELREVQRVQRRLVAEQEKQEREKQFQQKYEARIDTIAKAIEKGEDISVGYNEYSFGGKNPILDLFKLYDVSLPLRTQGWVNTGLASITENSYRYYKGKNQRDSTVFMGYLTKLKNAIKETPIEQKRNPIVDMENKAVAEIPEIAEMATAMENLPSNPTNESADNTNNVDNRLVETPEDVLGAFSGQKIPPMFVVDWEEVKYDFDLNLYEDGDMVAYNKEGVSFKVGKSGSFTYITTTTSLTPMGDILGDKDIPSYIRQQMREYLNGDITAEQVREQTLERLEAYTKQPADEITQSEQLKQVAPTIEYPISISHSPLLKGWYDVLGQNEELTFALARKCNEEAFLPMSITQQRRKLEPFFERVTAPVLGQSKLSDSAFEVFYKELEKVHKVERQVSLLYAHLGNGLSVSNRLYESDDRDYEKLAHIDSDRNITWHSKELPEELRTQIINTAETSTADYFVSLDIHAERKEWLSMIDDMVRTNGFIAKEDFSYTPFDRHGGLAKFVELYGIDDYERVINRINKETLPQGLDNLHELFKKQYPNSVIAVAAQAGFVDVRNIPADTGLSLSVKEGYFRRRVSGQEYGKLLKSLRNKGVAVVSVYPESGEIFADRPDEAIAREVEQIKASETHNQSNEHIENVDGIDFVFTTVRGEQQALEDVQNNEPPTWYSKDKNIPYKQGDIVSTRNMSVEILRLNDEGVHYRFIGDTSASATPVDTTEIKNMPRSQFETNLDSGRYQTITSGEVEVYVGIDLGKSSTLPTQKLDAPRYTITPFSPTEQVVGNDQTISLVKNEDAPKKYVIIDNLLARYLTDTNGFSLTFDSIAEAMAYTVEDEEHTERFEVTQTSDAFADPEDAYAIWDNEYDKYYEDSDRLYTFATAEEAESFLAKLTGKVIQTEISDTEPRTNDKEADIKAIVEAIGADENLLRWLIEQQVNERTINEFGRFDKLHDSVDIEKARTFFEKREGVELSHLKIRIKSYELLREFVLNGKFEITTEPPQQPKSPTYQGTPMWQDYQAIVAQYNGQLLFYRLDGYYEVLGDKAHTVADALDIAVTARDVGLAERVLFASVPHHMLENYLQILNEKGFDVVVRHGQDEIVSYPSIQPSIDENSQHEPAEPNRTPQVGDELYHNGELYRLDGINDIIIKLYNLEENHATDIITTQERFFEGLQKDERNRHLFYEKAQDGLPVTLNAGNDISPLKYDVDKIYDYVKSKNLDNRGQNRLLREIQQKLNTARFIGGIRRDPTAEEAKEADLWLRERHPHLYEALSEEQTNTSIDLQETAQTTQYNPDTATAKIDNLATLKADPHETVSGNEVQPLSKFSTLEAIESELDRKIDLMLGSPDYEKIKEATSYWKNWRNISHRVGIATKVLVDQINELDDTQAVDWFSGISWENWREALDIGDFEPLSAKIHRDEMGESEQTEENAKTPVPQNFRMDNIDYADIAAGGAKSKFKRNIEAIRTLQAIEAEKRVATAEEQKILAHYVGWGGVSEAFQFNSQQWREEAKELQALLTPEEYQAARASVLTAYYTEPTIMNAMWDKVEELGGFRNYGDNLKSVSVLEPSMGVGNFYSVIPEHLGNNATMHGVELDSISGRIAKLLYPDAKVQIKGFERTAFRDDFFDVVIGNVPFSESIKPVDWKYDKEKFLVHDYFFNKALDKVRPGGVVAFITSAGTLDKVDDKARIAMAEKAELLGAIRLPNNVFKQNAGTEVVSDIIFLQKREEPLDLSKSDIIPNELDWVHSVVTREAINDRVNNIWRKEQRMSKYFADNPHMIIGEYKEVSGRYGPMETVLPIEGANLGEQLREAMAHIVGSIPVREIPEVEQDDEIATKYISYDHTLNGFYDNEGKHIEVKDSSYTLVDGEVYFRNHYRLKLVNENATTLERIKGMVSLRNVLRDLIQAQVDDRPFIEIQHLQDELNTAYDNFSKKYGLITSKTNENAFDDDDSYYLLSSLEMLNDELEFEGKSDIFTKRTIKPHIEITSCNSSVEAFGVSIGYRGYVDLDYMGELTGFDKQRIINDLEGVIFYCPQEGDYLPADEYLSGNVRKKLEIAKAYAEEHPDYAEQYKINININALEKAQPKDLEAHEIYVRLGTTWIDRKYIQQFMYEILETPSLYKGLFKDGDISSKWNSEKRDEKDRITVQYSPTSNEWRVTNKNAISGQNIKADIEYGTGRINAYHILEQTLNLKDIVIKDKIIDDEGKEREVVNEEETVLAKQKQEDLKATFRDWIFKDPERRETLVGIYNKKFNTIRPREYDGKHIIFGGMNAEITLEEHQVNAVARVMYGGNTLLAHEVGAGKSFEMIAAAMESKRIGQCSKSLIVVPKHLTGQMASEFLRLYPNANILVATDKTFEPKNRKRFCSKIVTGNYDAIIMGHTQFEMIPLSKENQEKYYTEQFDLLVDAINEAKAADSGYFTVKQMENTKNKVKTKLENLYKEDRKDDVITFEQLGIDKLFVDEAHSFKDL